MKDPVVRKAKQTLVELDKSVQKEQQEKVCERAVALKNIWRETCDAMDSMNTQKSAIEKTIASVGVASIGVGTYMGTRSIVDSMSLGALAYSPLTSTSRVISNEIVKLKKPNHISVCWDYSTKIRRIKKAKGLIA
jgi:seryl-tRNA synthetase